MVWFDVLSNLSTNSEFLIDSVVSCWHRPLFVYTCISIFWMHIFQCCFYNVVRGHNVKYNVALKRSKNKLYDAWSIAYPFTDKQNKLKQTASLLR